MSELTGLAEKLKRAGHKLTAPRQAVVQVLEQEGSHLSPNEILAQGRQNTNYTIRYVRPDAILISGPDLPSVTFVQAPEGTTLDFEEKSAAE